MLLVLYAVRRKVRWHKLHFIFVIVLIVSCLEGTLRLTAQKLNELLCSADYGFSHAEVQLRKEISYCRTQAVVYSRIEHYLKLSIVNLRLVQDAFTYV